MDDKMKLLEQLAENYARRFNSSHGYDGESLSQEDIMEMRAYIEGFKAAMELVKDKLFTREQLIDFTEKCMIIANETDNIGRLQRFISKQAESLLPQTEWNVKINEQGKLELI